ncbi:hypothetical protein A2721_00265 [Candidatus Gottesmanbacteria bacterium RIFCSPHIGHO2_01_FULL_47_48]|uniref:DUF6922 domain-containing protein n=1 Tax=Candidatus Gottesmanbacteria bacterium RIFCSPHIGHO2_01_FULL_47_48 TaxID=1798381 RepID=A0A1F6A3F9_9BACT|nr:MAG: hypothetical protein A2721_00265 [Candidatus Gottesmanbacteria bacterium RIFCSPHIGHO2_01_FULL_47_48]
MAIPKFLQSALWSYDLSKLNLQKNKSTIVTQIINYGTKEQLNWLLKTYSAEEIKYIVMAPQRGIWLRETLRHWLTKLDLVLDPLIFESAIRSLDPRPKLNEAYFQRIGLIK